MTRVILILYRLAWIVLLPVVLVYLWRRGRRDPDYLRHLGERFGRYRQPTPTGVIWLHVVSLGETRSAISLIEALLARGERVLLTHFTPAGRRESARVFAAAIASGQLTVVWVPFDMAWCYRRFFRAFRPRIGLTLEVEIWPSMIFTARAAGVPLYLCNGQYATRSLERDRRGLGLRLRVVRGLAGALVKSTLQAERFRAVGLTDVTVTGELRFDQPVPAAQVQAAARLRAQVDPARRVIAIASGVEGEEALFIGVIERILAREGGAAAPLFVYVPRAPERFEAVARGLEAAGLRVGRRSRLLAPDLSGSVPFDGLDVLVGDSLGEMFFYLALADQVIVGGGFTPRGAHNVIEPIMLGKPVLVGPHVWTIDYPFAEAAGAGIARSVPDAEALLSALLDPQVPPAERFRAFLAEHAGATERTLAAIDRVLGRSDRA
jgi:3-deoxy-D-manno-octulosonic-acid transferase